MFAHVGSIFIIESSFNLIVDTRVEPGNFLCLDSMIRIAQGMKFFDTIFNYLCNLFSVLLLEQFFEMLIHKWGELEFYLPCEVFNWFEGRIVVDE